MKFGNHVIVSLNVSEKLKYFRSNKRTSWLTIRPLYNKELLSIDWVDYRGDAAYRLSGLWESIDQAKGGPFVGYLFYDYASDRTFYVTYMVFNPGGRKAFYMKQMELFIKTLNTE